MTFISATRFYILCGWKVDQGRSLMGEKKKSLLFLGIGGCSMVEYESLFTYLPRWVWLNPWRRKNGNAIKNKIVKLNCNQIDWIVWREGCEFAWQLNVLPNYPCHIRGTCWKLNQKMIELNFEKKICLSLSLILDKWTTTVKRKKERISSHILNCHLVIAKYLYDHW